MTTSEADRAAIDWPVIPEVAWHRPIGEPCIDVGRPRVHVPMIDDGEWAGVPIGGLGTGSIGRTFRGDFARWHLDVGHHRFEPVVADGFSLFVGRTDGSTQATVLGVRPTREELESWGWGLPVGGGTYHALFPRAWQSFQADVVGVNVIGEQLSPVIGGDLARSALPVGVFEWWIENPGSEPVTVAVMATFADPPGGPGDGPPAARAHSVRHDEPIEGIAFGDPGPAAATASRGTLALAALGDDWAITTAPVFDPVADIDLWSDFATDGRLTRATPARAESP
ncbi:MAG TPA: GH116 family glycosyl-hydrolase, partial [Candidatus Limnocylindrales bacterium]|nr:GH116 family glycosyl-hydrolase [Candidatus Limnocylindrales bacterium]